MGIALLATILLYLFFRYARLGVAMRAVVDNPDLVNVTGTNPIAVRRSAWIIGTVFAALSGVLIAPTIGLNSLLLILLVVQAFGAAAVGYFSNLPLTYIGGLAIGIAASVSTQVRAARSRGWAVFPPSLPFIVLFIALLVTPKRLLVQRRTPPPPPPRNPVQRSPAGEHRVRGRRRRAARVRARHRREQPVVLDRRPADDDPVPVARAARARVGSGVAVPVHVRGRGRGGVLPSRQRPRRALVAGAAARRTGGGARRA